MSTKHNTDTAESSLTTQHRMTKPTKRMTRSTLIGLIIVGLIIGGTGFAAGYMIGTHAKTGQNTMSRPSGFPGDRNGQMPSGSGSNHQQMSPPSSDSSDSSNSSS